MEKPLEEKLNKEGERYFNFETSEIISERDYIEAASSYSIRSGWVRPENKEKLVNDYLLSIYNKYQEILGEVKKEINGEHDAEAIMAKIIRALNLCLQATRRIGVASPDDIMRGIEDMYRMRRGVHNYMEYALESFKEHIRDILNQ